MQSKTGFIRDIQGSDNVTISHNQCSSETRSLPIVSMNALIAFERTEPTFLY